VVVMVIRRLFFFMVLVVLAVYNFNIFFGSKANKGVEPLLRRNEQLITTSFHKDGHENAWIKDVDRQQNLVLVRTVDTGIRIVFHTNPSDVKRFNEGWITGVTFDCGQKPKEKCDLSKPYKLYVSNMLVEPIEINQ